MEGVCAGIRLSILPDVHELPWGERLQTGWYPPRSARTCAWSVGSTRASRSLGTGHRDLWQRLEGSKRRLAYALVALGLRLVSKQQDPGGFAFAFLSDPDSAFRESNALRPGHPVSAR